MSYHFRAQLWQPHGGGSWHFVTLPHDQSDEIDELTATTTRGFGSVRVVVTVGATTWQTSIFPDTKAASFVLPIKRAVRTAERLKAGDFIDVGIDIAEI